MIAVSLEVALFGLPIKTLDDHLRDLAGLLFFLFYVIFNAVPRGLRIHRLIRVEFDDFLIFLGKVKRIIKRPHLPIVLHLFAIRVQNVPVLVGVILDEYVQILIT